MWYLFAVPRDVIDLIASLSDDELATMRQKNQRDLARAEAEVARLRLQEQQFAMAVAKRERKKPGRPGSLTAEVVLDAAGETEPPRTAKDITATLVKRGLDVSVNAVRNHLNKLVKDGDLEKNEDGTFSIPGPIFVPAEFSASAADDDIPF